MKRLSILLLSIFSITASYADKVNLKLLYRQLDAVIDSSAFYQKQKADARYRLSDFLPEKVEKIILKRITLSKISRSR